jgi:meiotically up-regulated gene 157 (Mug157) protein
VGTGFMHESFWKNNASSYTRPWFAWANTMYGHLIMRVSQTYPNLIFSSDSQ